jgi:hypothetical protein
MNICNDSQLNGLPILHNVSTLQSLMEPLLSLLTNLYNKRVCPTNNESQQQGFSYLEREREGVKEREGGRGGGQQAGVFKNRLSLGEIDR